MPTQRIGAPGAGARYSVYERAGRESRRFACPAKALADSLSPTPKNRSEIELFFRCYQEAL
jgi:hypothetical protein